MVITVQELIYHEVIGKPRHIKGLLYFSRVKGNLPDCEDPYRTYIELYDFNDELIFTISPPSQNVKNQYNPSMFDTCDILTSNSDCSATQITFDETFDLELRDNLAKIVIYEEGKSMEASGMREYQGP